MANDTERPTGATLGEGRKLDSDAGSTRPDDPAEAEHGPSEHDVRVTRIVHVVLGLVVAAVGAWMLYRSETELPFRGSNGEPGPGYLPVLLTTCLIALGLALSAVWLVGPRARSGDVPALSLKPPALGRALLGWLALVICTVLIEPFGFLIAGEVLVLLVILVVERMRSIPSIIALLLVPPAMYLLFEILLEVQLPPGTVWQ
ncbi:MULTISPECIES: tripartite tricarboxylate transporter TctB family protein [unclassified Mycobacterium]|uniref:tripartite tricarboxylate transporter TctB family protein n=1 Tax=unclassified Mycobacterium TaxID=2642494 RepID=UPI0029C765D1|nr:MULTISPECIES: tripartite tricarboxylate transporter TctB family protein [unclassified Mycobacterium]